MTTIAILITTGQQNHNKNNQNNQIKTHDHDKVKNSFKTIQDKNHYGKNVPQQQAIHYNQENIL